MAVFLGVYKAVYDYEPQTPEELAIREDDLLYLLEKSDVDDWWTVKKRVIGSEAEEPVGLVPSNYVEVADVLYQKKALYDYHEVQNPDEELIFNENDVFDVFDDKDQDWLLVRSVAKNEYGFVPGNYIGELDDGVGAGMAAGAIAAPTVTPVTATAAPIGGGNTIDINALPPPPQHSSRAEIAQSSQEDSDAPPSMPTRPTQSSYDRGYDDEDTSDMPPSKPQRPTGGDNDYNDTRERARSRLSDMDNDYQNDSHEMGRDRSYSKPDNRVSDGDLHTWSVAEIEGRKKKKAKLSINRNRIFYTPQKGDPQDWTIDKLISYDNEKKHMFLEFIDPYKSLELHTGTNDVCEEIMTFISEIKGASRDTGIREVEMASKSKKKGKVLFDFEAESRDELTIRAGDTVYILDDQKSKDWLLCELVDSGKRGVVPTQFIEPVQEKLTSNITGGLFKSLKKLTKGAMSPTKTGSNSNISGTNWQDDEMDDVSGNGGRRNRSGSSSNRKRSSGGRGELPSAKKSRIWEDRTGKFKVEAEFIGCKDGKIHLHKANGVKIAVAADKLSDEDLVFVERLTGFSLNKYKMSGGSGGGGSSSNSDPRESERERRRVLREQEEKERERRLRERELNELKKARDLLEDERQKLKELNDRPPSKPPRPQSGDLGNRARSQSQGNKSNYDWFEFFLNCGVDVSNCQRYGNNFEKERLTEDMLPEINSSMLRTLGLREGDIVRVMKNLDQKFERDGQQNKQQSAATGGMFSKPDGSLINNNPQVQPAVAQQLLPQNAAVDDDEWTVKPAAKAEKVQQPEQANFTGSMQDLLDLKPLEPNKAENAPEPAVLVPQPNVKNLEPVKTGTAQVQPVAPVQTGGIQAQPVAPVQTGGVQAQPLAALRTGGASNLVPLDPFKTGGHNVLPINTGYVLMPIATGGAMLSQMTGGVVMPQTTFGAQMTGGAMPLQSAAVGGMMPQTTFGAMPLQRTGGALPAMATGGALPATSFNLPPSGSVLPVQKTGSGLVPINMTGGMAQTNITGGLLQTNLGGGMMPAQRTGGLPQTSFDVPQLTGGAMNMMPATSFGAPQMTGGAMNMMPNTSFGAPQMTGGAMNMMPNTSFGAPQMTGGAMNMMPNTSFGAPQMTGGVMPMQNGSFSNVQQQNSFQPHSNFGMELQRTGNAMNQLPAFNNNVNTMNQTQNFGQQNQNVQPLQNQPTGFGFGNAPQQAGQANLFNASAANPFGF